MIGEILTGLDSIVDKSVPDADTKLKMQNEVLRLAMASADKQADINKVEAGHKSIYVAGWRPFIGWVCGFALATMFIVKPTVIFVMPYFGVDAVLIAQVAGFTLNTGELMSVFCLPCLD